MPHVLHTRTLRVLAPMFAPETFLNPRKVFERLGIGLDQLFKGYDQLRID